MRAALGVMECSSRGSFADPCAFSSGLQVFKSVYARCQTNFYAVEQVNADTVWLLVLLQADKDEARSQHAAAVSELEALSQQLATASTAKSQAESAAEELQATHDALVEQHAALQTQVRGMHSTQHKKLTAAGAGSLFTWS